MKTVERPALNWYGLNDDAGPGPPEIAGNDHQHDIAAGYFHNSQW